MCWNKGLRLGRDGSEDTFLGEALAVCAASVLGLIEAGAANLATRQYKLSCDARWHAGIARIYGCMRRVIYRPYRIVVERTFLLLQYRHAMAVLWRGAG